VDIGERNDTVNIGELPRRDRSSQARAGTRRDKKTSSKAFSVSTAGTPLSRGNTFANQKGWETSSIEEAKQVVHS
jgi:hypothetical protein